MNIIEQIYKIGCKFANIIWWPNWSNIRWHKAIRENIAIRETDNFSDLAELQIILNSIYRVFTYTKDDKSQLYDSIVPPPQLYTDYLNGSITDDCDGFHAAVYHILANNNIECYLMSVNALGSGHCVLICNYNSKWHAIDYTHIYSGYDTLKSAIEAYNLSYSAKYKTRTVLYNGFLGYNYEKRKFKAINIKF